MFGLLFFSPVCVFVCVLSLKRRGGGVYYFDE
jgi:hypothetical protein